MYGHGRIRSLIVVFLERGIRFLTMMAQSRWAESYLVWNSNEDGIPVKCRFPLVLSGRGPENTVL